MRVLFTTGVWGREYIDKFLSLSLPSQLAEGNLGDAPWLVGSRYLIVTSAAGAQQLRESADFASLSRLIETEVRVLEALSRPLGPCCSKYELMNLCQLEAIRTSSGFDAIMFGYADTLWGSGTFQRSAERLASGYQAVFAPGLPVREAEFMAALRADSSLWKQRGDAKTLSVGSRTLVSLVLEHLHPMATANYWHNRSLGVCPAYTLFDVPGQGVALRAFHLHPVMIRTQPNNPRFLQSFRSSLDEGYISSLYPSKDGVYFPLDSDEFMLCSLMQPFQQSFESAVPPTPRALALWAEAHASPVHREFFHEEYRLHYTDIDEPRWRSVQIEGTAVAASVASRLSIPDSVLSVEDPEAYAARSMRVARIKRWKMWQTLSNPKLLLRAARGIARRGKHLLSSCALKLRCLALHGSNFIDNDPRSVASRESLNDQSEFSQIRGLAVAYSQRRFRALRRAMLSKWDPHLATEDPPAKHLQSKLPPSRAVNPKARKTSHDTGNRGSQ